MTKGKPMTEQSKKQDASMDEILSSIRSIVNEEMDKKSQATDDVLELTEEIDNDIPTGDLGVTSAIADAPTHQVEDDLIDINAFSEQGVVQAADPDTISQARDHYNAQPDAERSTEEPVENTDVAVQEAAEALDALEAISETAPADESVDDIMAAATDTADEVAQESAEDVQMDASDIDAMMSGMADTPESATIEETEAAVAEDSVEDIMASAMDATEEQAQLSEDDMANLETEVVSEPDTSDVEERAVLTDSVDEDDLSTAATESLIQRAVAASNSEESAQTRSSEITETTKRINLKAIPSANASLQIGFPLEVLAEALRPMVKDWVEENLQEVVERLVREEIQKMTSQQ